LWFLQSQLPAKNKSSFENPIDISISSIKRFACRLISKSSLRTPYLVITNLPPSLIKKVKIGFFYTIVYETHEYITSISYDWRYHHVFLIATGSKEITLSEGQFYTMGD
jgi:hypothetical protein